MTPNRLQIASSGIADIDDEVMMLPPTPSLVPTEPASEESESVFVFPATTAQRRFWLLEQMQSPDNPALSMTFGLRWRGPLEPEVMRCALNAVIARHETLRTTFEIERSQLRQIIAPTLELELPVEDAHGPVLQLMRAEAARPFDLARGPLLRARLLRLTSAEHLLLLTAHHIISDDASNGVIARDLCVFYRAFLEGKPPALPELPLQFADFADWQQARLTNDDFAGQRNYWRTQLAGEPAALDLPVTQPAAPTATTAAETRSRILPAELVRAAKAFGVAEEASAFMIFFAAFQALLHRYTGQVDFLVTSPSANRDRPEFEALVGLFVNPLLLRADLAGDPNFRELVGRVRRVAREAFARQDIPFGLLLDEFHAARLQANFQYEAGWRAPENLPSGVAVELLPATSAGTVYELSATVAEELAGLRVEFEYKSALFDAATIDRMLAHYEMLLRGAVADPAQTISRLPMLTAEEEARFGLQIEPEAAVSSLALRDLLAERVLAQPDAIVARHGRRELSCAELLLRLETEHNDAVTELDQVAAWIAHWRARAEGTAPEPIARTAAMNARIAAASAALHESTNLLEQERVASSSPPGIAATEEIGAIFLTKATMVYPTSDLLADSDAIFAAWLNAEDISVAFLPATLWNRFTAAVAANRARLPAKLRLVVVSEDGTNRAAALPNETSFEGVRVLRRMVSDAAGGTIVLDERMLPAAAEQLRIVDRAGQALPIGLAGDLKIADSSAHWKSTGERARWLPNESIELLAPSMEESSASNQRSAFRRRETALAALSGARPEPVRPYLGLQLQLIAIWEDVLRVRGIGIRDDFFELGGNSLLAIRMLQRAEAVCGKMILPAALFRQPTIEHLAGEIAREVIDQSPSLLRVNDAGTRTPFFYLHGDLSGGGFYSLKLSRALGTEQPFYVMPPHDIRLLPAAPTIEEMAAAHLQALRAVRPRGPYVIGGFCIGGLVAFELAQQLRARGEVVEMLLIIDAAPESRGLRALRRLATTAARVFHWDDDETVRQFGRLAVWRARLAEGIAQNVRAQTRQAPKRIYERAAGIYRAVRTRWSSSKSADPLAAEIIDQEIERDLPSAFQWASAGYRPKPYDSPLALLLSEDVIGAAQNPSRAWAALAPALTVHALPGSHLECITAHVETLAREIDGRLENIAASLHPRN